MGVRREILYAVFQAIITAVLIGAGILSGNRPFWDNLIVGLVAAFIARILALTLGGRGK